MGAVSALLLAAAFAAAPAPDSFRFDGPSASAMVDGGPAALRVDGAVREGKGSAFLRGEDRVRGHEMTYGDAGELWVRIRTDDQVYRVELDAVGFPPEAALPKDAGGRRGWWLTQKAAPRPPKGGVEGGVMLGRVVNGDSGHGVRDMPARRAAVALWGVGRLYRNDELVAPRARILAQVVPGGASREGALEAQEPRRELDVFVDQVPVEVSQAGFVHFVLEGASLAGPPARVARKQEAAPAPRQETREEQLSRRPTTEELWNSGASMIAWRDEAAPAEPVPVAGPAMEEGGAPAPGGAAAPGSAAVNGTASAYAPGGAAAPGSAAMNGPATGSTASGAATAPSALASNQWMTPGTQTVIQPPPPLLAVPATPNTAPIQYETGQNGGTIGFGPIGGGAGGTAVYGGSGLVGTGVFNNATPPPSGVFSGMNAPTATSPTTPPPVPNATAPAVPSGGPTALPPTPQPLNAQPAPIPGATAPVPTQLPAQTQPAPPIQSQSTPAFQAPAATGP